MAVTIVKHFLATWLMCKLVVVQVQWITLTQEVSYKNEGWCKNMLDEGNQCNMYSIQSKYIIWGMVQFGLHKCWVVNAILRAVLQLHPIPKSHFFLSKMIGRDQSSTLKWLYSRSQLLNRDISLDKKHSTNLMLGCCLGVWLAKSNKSPPRLSLDGCFHLNNQDNQLPKGPNILNRDSQRLNLAQYR